MLIGFDGKKSVNLLHSDDPSVWQGLRKLSDDMQTEYYSRVAAAFRAFNLKANTVASIPFVLLDKNGDEFDNSATWENKVGFLPNPFELFRLNTLSYMVSNTFYNLKTMDVFGYKQKGLYHAIASSFTPITDPVTGQLIDIERNVNGRIEHYKPDDKRLVRAWRLDHTTEILPSPHTEAKAIMAAAGVLFFEEYWIQNFYRSGGIKPTLVAMKGLLDLDSKEEQEKGWDNFLKGIRNWWSRRVRIFNSEAMDIKPFGSGIDDIKDNHIHLQSLEDIAMGTGMPLSLLMANSANYATAKEEKATWFDSDIIPLSTWMAYEYNRQEFEPMGLYLEFRPETLDPQQEDETERAQAVNSFMDFLTKCPTYDVFIGTAETFGYELSDSLITAAEKYYADKEKQAEKVRQQMQDAGVVLTPDNKPIIQKEGDEKIDEKEDEKEEKPANKWIPSLDEYKELSVWRDVALRRNKKGETMDFTYEPHYGGLPEWVTQHVASALLLADTQDAIKAAFDITAISEVKAVTTETPAPVFTDPILVLADALNNLKVDSFTHTPVST